VAPHRIGKFNVFLSRVRAKLFDEAFQAEPAAVYEAQGTVRVPSALPAMVTLLQACDRVGDADRVVATRIDRRWQLALGYLAAP
jgi:hypothetical protein